MKDSAMYAFGFGTNSTIKRRVSELELEDNARLLCWMTGRNPFQLFHTFEDYRARSSSRERRIVTQVEITERGTTNVGFVVTNMSGLAGDHKLMTHLLAYALYVLFREANEKTPELNKMEVRTARTRLLGSVRWCRRLIVTSGFEWRAIGPARHC